MATINYAAREISVKIVYYGPGLSGKTTNLQIIHRKIPQNSKSDMVSLATETDRTLFFDFLPLDLGKIRGFTTKFQLYTVPGQVYYNATRKLVLRGVDGIVFIADSAADKMEENIESFKNMEENLSEYGYKRETIPIIMQYNKRDLSNALPSKEINSKLNKYSLPWSEAIANRGKGVFESLKLIGKLVIDYLNQKYASSSTKRPITTPKPIRKGVQKAPSPLPAQPKPVQSPQLKKQQFPSGQPAYTPRSPYVPTQPSTPRTQAPPPPPKPSPQSPGQYGTINLEPMTPQKGTTQPSSIPSTPRGAQSGLDEEMERYYKSAQSKQAPQDQFTQQKLFVSPQQPSPAKTPLFDNTIQQNAQYKPVTPQQQRPPAQPFRTQPPQHAQPPNISGANHFPSPPPIQQTKMPPSTQYPPKPSGNDIGDEPLYFTSVNTDKFKRKGKKPVNPKHKTKKSFFGKLFNRDSL